MRTRECVNPKPQFGGIPCKGSTTVMRGCTNTSSCLQESPVRFQTEGSPSTGVMQIHKNNAWKALCTAHWENSEAILACQVNGYNYYSNDNFTGNWKRGNTSLVNITSHSCSSIIQSCGLINTQIQCSVPVRLSGAKAKYGGRVEVFYRRRWGKICRNTWDINDVKVVCKQLGFRGALAEFMTGMNTNDENIPIVMSDIACTGQESVLAQCNRLDEEHKCPEDIGAQALCVPNNVEVLEKKIFSSNLGGNKTVQCSLKKEKQNEHEMVKWYKIGATAIELNPDERIEVKGVTLTIKNVQLDDGGTYECRGQRYTRFYTVYVNAEFKNKRPQQKLTPGKPGQINCTAEGNPPPQFEWRKNNSLLLEDDRFTQLSDGSLHIDTVRLEDKGVYECSMKQTKGRDRITVYLQHINVSVIDLRLVGGTIRGEGRVEIYHKGVWGTVCDDGWDIKDAQVVCRALGFLSAVAAPRGTRFGKGSGVIWLEDVDCAGFERSLKDCGNRGWGRHDCDHDEDASVECLMAPVVYVSPQYQTVVEGEATNISCKASSVPLPKLSWKFENGELPTDAVITNTSNPSLLLLPKTAKSMEGWYQCIAKNEAGEESSNSTLHVLVVPVVYVSPQNQTVVEGETSNISCKASGEPQPNLSWKFENGELPTDAVITNTSNQSLLLLPKTAKSMEGWYQCIAKNEAGEESSNSTLHVLELPTTEISANPYPTMLEGDKLTLTCKTNEVTSQIKWKKNNVLKIPRANITENGDSSILVIEKVEVSDSGEYSCQALNKAGSASSSVDIEIRAAPVVYVSPQNQTVVEGQTTNINCKASGVPHPKLSWKFENGELPTSAVITNTSNSSLLLLPKTAKSMEGWYQCIAKNEAGEESSNSTLHVLVAPVVYVSPQSQTVVEGQTTNISCKASGVPHPKLSWKFENGELPTGAVITNALNPSLLLLPKNAKNMEGWYQCIAKNEAGEESSNSTLHVLELPTAEISPNPYPTMLEGFKLTLTCKTNEVTSQIKWKKNNVLKIPRANITENGDSSILVIEKVEVSDSGEYSCQALNKAGSASSSVDIEIRGLQEQRPAIGWYYIVGPLSAVVLSALIVWYLCKRRMTATARSQGATEEHEMEVLNVEVDSWEIARRQIALEEVIGSGAFGTVWRATLSRKNGRPGIRFVAAKCFSPTSGDEGKVALMREIGLGKLIGDSPQPNIVQFIGCVTTQIQPILIMEYLPCGDLLGYLRKSRGIFDKHYCGKLAVAPLKTYDLMSFSNQIATGMVFLASRGIIHRDLAARNVLLDQNRVCKVTDFGLAYQNFKYGHGNAKKGCMPIKWTAPEILFGDPANLSSKSDVWSYGVVLYEIFTIGGIPYPGWSEGKTMEELKRGYRMPKPAHIANNLYNLMEMCWQEIPVLRPDFVNISKRLRSFIEGEYLPLVDKSKYDGAKYSGVEDVGAETEDDARGVRGATNAKASTRKWSSLKL
ncbi:inactive tyrosine-protein kinase 7-like [Montipora foliosa]|uniref:inactive tyrosine-protein kinase 7-like n=1 Tax=Montipora foliosa TaxID=591990 RepID=UPI0035F21995